MLNQAIFVGRLVENPEVKKSENGNDYSNFTIAVQRSYKNAEGVYDTDFIDVKTFGAIASNTTEYCKKGDVVGVKGRIQTSYYETEDGNKRKNVEIIADKISFLSSAKSKNTESEKDNDDLDI